MTHVLGATVVDGGVRFAAWSTRARSLAVRFFDEQLRPTAAHELPPQGDHLFEGVVAGLGVNALYKFVLDGERELPDPYARSLPFGVDGPARVVGPLPKVTPLSPPPFERWVVYELHLGTFTPEGTFRAAAAKLADLARLGINAVEIMPVHSFPGRRGWGYDGVALFAPFAGYGDREDLAALVDQAHRLGIAVLLDVVLNHFGPASNYLPSYSPEYFTSRHKNPWGDAPDYTNPYMRELAVGNALHWLRDYGFDGLRLDATHAIVDPSPVHVLREIADAAAAMTPPRVLVAEDERNDPAVVTRLGMRAVWADDFHHQVRVQLTKERDGYYAAYEPNVEGLARAIERGWLYEGQVYPPTGKPRGKPAELPLHHLVYCIQNHDQIGNRALGTRLNHDAPLEAYAAVSVLLLFLPAVPMVFMGQEWGASTPFLYFSDHAAELGKLVSAGRREEFKGFAAFTDAGVRESIPDPQAEDTFLRSKLAWAEREVEPHARILALYRDMLGLRRSDPVLSDPKGELTVAARGEVLTVTRSSAGDTRALLVNFGREPAPLPPGRVVLASTHLDGSLPPQAAVIVAV